MDHRQRTPTEPTVRQVDTGGGDYAEGNIDKRTGTFIEQQIINQPALLPAVTLTPQQRRNRALMLDKVESIWVKGLLQRSLSEETRIALGLEDRPDAVDLPLNALVQELHHPPQEFPPGTSITSVFDQTGGSLLILGAPGAGKTTLLLELARDLINRARGDETCPIPVVFNLSSWATERKSLKDWFVEQLFLAYQAPRSTGKAWIDGEGILPLLDGLDEVAAEHRDACVEAINAYRGEAMVPLTVCSRVKDYAALAGKLRLQGAVLVQPLQEQQVDAYLDRLGGPMLGVRARVRDDPTLRELLGTPLMLAVMVLTFKDRPAGELRQMGSIQELWERYVERMFERRSADKRWPREKVMHPLAWLAWQMRKHQQTAYYIEGMQPNWLSSTQRRSYVVGVGLIVGLVYGVMLAASYTIAAGLAIGLVAGAINGLVVGLTTGTIMGTSRIQQRLRQRGWQSIGISVPVGLGIAVLVGSGFGLVTSLFPQVITHAAGQLQPVVVSPWLTGLIMGLYMSLQTGMAIGIILAVVPSVEQISGVETMRWSWGQLSTGDWRRGLLALAGGLGIALTIGVMLLLTGAWQLGVVAAGTVLMITIVSMLLVIGTTTGVIETKTVPNQGIRRSARHALIVGGLLGLLAGGIGGGLQSLLGADMMTSIKVGVSYILGVAVMGALAFGGLACLQHAVLRWLLWRSDATPLRYAAFLDACAERILLRRVGGGWIFIHRLLLEHLADTYEATPQARS